VKAPHEPLEGATDEDPRQNIWSIGGRDAVRCDQCNGDVDVAPERTRIPIGKEQRTAPIREKLEERVIAEEGPSVSVIVICNR
jgi:hypothetical protein